MSEQQHIDVGQAEENESARPISVVVEVTRPAHARGVIPTPTIETEQVVLESTARLRIVKRRDTFVVTIIVDDTDEVPVGGFTQSDLSDPADLSTQVSWEAGDSWDVMLGPQFRDLAEE